MPPENLFQVGEYIEMFNEVTGQDLPCGPIYQSHGLQAHVQKRHPSDISHLSCVPLIISAPDYIGKHPKEPNSIELVKVLSGNVMICIKLDRCNQYFYVGSVVTITDGKLKNRLNSGRLRPVDKSEKL